MEKLLDYALVVLLFIPPFLYFFGGVILDIMEGIAEENKDKEVQIKKMRKPKATFSRFSKSKYKNK